MDSQVWDNFWQLGNWKLFINDQKCFLCHLSYFWSQVTLVIFGLKIFKFLSWLFSHVEKWLDYKDKFNFKIYDIATWLTNTCNTLLTNISKSKDNQKMKFDQSIEYNINIFLKKSITKYDGETISGSIV